jgi:hypothetical protein
MYMSDYYQQAIQAHAQAIADRKAKLEKRREGIRKQVKKALSETD